MKRPFAVVLLFLSLLAVGRADPAEDLDKAIRALLAQPNFSWKTTFDRSDNGRNCSYDGKTERGGPTIVTTARRNLIEGEIADNTERPVMIVYAGERCVARLEDTWHTPKDVGTLLTGNHPVGPDILGAVAKAQSMRGILGGLGSKTTVWEDEGAINTPRPDLILSILLRELDNVKAGGRAITADIMERGVIRLFESKLAIPDLDWGGFAVQVRSPQIGTTTSSRTGVTTPVIRPASDTPTRTPRRFQMVRFRDGKGEGTFWIADGMLAKFELRLEAIGSGAGQGNGTPHHVVITAILNDVGATIVELPAGARQRLEQ